MTADQLALNVLLQPWPDAHTECQPDTDRTPTAFDVRRAEVFDCLRQGVREPALWDAHTIPTGSYL